MLAPLKMEHFLVIFLSCALTSFLVLALLNLFVLFGMDALQYRVVRKDQLRVHSMENIKDPNCEQVGFVCPGTDLVVVEVRGR